MPEDGSLPGVVGAWFLLAFGAAAALSVIGAGAFYFDALPSVGKAIAVLTSVVAVGALAGLLVAFWNSIIKALTPPPQRHKF